MAWADARSAIKTVLEAVSITSPVTLSIVRVYEFPPSNIADVPCVVLYPPARNVERAPGGLRIKTYTVRMRVLVSDRDLEAAAEMVDSFAEAIIDTFDDDLTLSGNAALVNGPSIEEAGDFVFAGKPYTGIDCLLDVQLSESRTFG